MNIEPKKVKIQIKEVEQEIKRLETKGAALPQFTKMLIRQNKKRLSFLKKLI